MTRRPISKLVADACIVALLCLVAVQVIIQIDRLFAATAVVRSYR